MKFLVRWRCDLEEVFTTDEVTIESHCFSVLDFVHVHTAELSQIETHNTIFSIERID